MFQRGVVSHQVSQEASEKVARRCHESEKSLRPWERKTEKRPMGKIFHRGLGFCFLEKGQFEPALRGVTAR